MNENKPPRVDGIPPKLLKDVVDQIGTPLAIFFILSLKEGIVHYNGKKQNITPLLKKKSRCNILFMIFLNDLDDALSSKVLIFAELFRTVKADEDTVQYGPTKLVKWSAKWQMTFNFEKCKCIHIGYGNVNKSTL